MSVTQTAEPVAMKRTMQTDGAGNSQPHEIFHPDQIAPETEHGNDLALKEGREALAYGGNMLAQIDKLRANPHPEDNAAKHARKVREAVDGLDNSLAHKFDSAKASLKARLRAVEADLEKSANLKPDSDYRNAILGKFDGMTQADKAKWLGKLIETQNGPVLATLLNAPEMVTEIGEQQRESLKLELMLKANPAGVALRDALNVALAKMEKASIASLHARAALREGTTRFDSRAREAEALANKARTGFGA